MTLLERRTCSDAFVWFWMVLHDVDCCLAFVGSFPSRGPVLLARSSRCEMCSRTYLQPELRQRQVVECSPALSWASGSSSDLNLDRVEESAWKEVLLAFEHISANNALCFGTSTGGDLLQLPECVGHTKRVSNFRSTGFLGDVELSSDASHGGQRAQFISVSSIKVYQSTEFQPLASWAACRWLCLKILMCHQNVRANTA